MEWLGMFNPDYWFYRQTRNDFARYWDGKEWQGFFASWLAAAAALNLIFVMMFLRDASVAFSWQAEAILACISAVIGLFLIPISAAIILMPAMAREEIRNRRESHRRYNEAMMESWRRRQSAKDQKTD